MFQTFGPAKILRPSKSCEQFVLERARDYLITRHKSGRYFGDEANRAIQDLFGFYERQLKQVTEQIACRSCAELLLTQYDEAGKILHGKGITDIPMRLEWKEIEGNFKRAIKYLVELICCESPGDQPKANNKMLVPKLEIALFCAEAVSSLAEMSERLHSLFPDQFFVEIDSLRSGMFLDIRISGENERFDERFYERVRTDRTSRDEFVEQPQFDQDTTKHFEILDVAFEEEQGISYREFLAIIKQAVEGSNPLEDGLQTLFIHRENLIEQLVKASGITSGIVSKVIDGFTVTPKSLIADKRVVWNPKQESRALRRGFFLFPHETGDHLAFSRSMAIENAIHLITSVPYQKLPQEWKTKRLATAVKQLSLEAGRWFERQVRRNMVSLGFHGSNVKHRIGRGDNRICIPSEIGEIDFIGYNSKENLLLLLECKMALTGLEARFWRDDLDRFVERKKSHRKQLLRKGEWILTEFQNICSALRIPANCNFSIAMVTLYPCIADEVIDEFRCISLAELMLDYKRHMKWPYGCYGGISGNA